ncbi:hypothetical protein B0H14DRAFT_2736881 [Mycena olivaceomarginata]|nr:hypothetical protein B0H14DRAFT_2736881 [Mycena olivaceomarginata]
MLSALWTIFSIGAGTLARRTGQSRQRLSTRADSEEMISGRSGRFALKGFGIHLHVKDSGWDMGTSSSFAFHKEPAPTHIRLEHLEDDMREMKHMMRLLLEKQCLADDRLDYDLKGIPNILEVKEEIVLPLVHRRSSSSDQA